MLDEVAVRATLTSSSDSSRSTIPPECMLLCVLLSELLEGVGDSFAESSIVSSLFSIERMPIRLSIGSVRPPQTRVVNITMPKVVDTYISLCSLGRFCAYKIKQTHNEIENYI